MVDVDRVVNSSVLDENVDVEPLADVYVDGFERVGKGKVTADTCGTFKGFSGCSREDLHSKILLDGVNYSGMVYMSKVHYSCGKPSCPVCYYKGWSVREAWNIEVRLKQASKRWGLVEHIICSVPLKDYGLDLEVLRGNAVKALRARGVVGGVMIFHAFRKSQFGVHFHVLGFIHGGYGCRGCKKVCFRDCVGFEARTRNLFKSDGFIVKVLDKRKTVGGTAWYQLNHASVKKGVERFHVATWFGVCSYRKLKVKVEFKRHVCPICQHDLVPHSYVGVRPLSGLCVKPFSDDSGDFRGSVEPLYEGGYRVWVEMSGGSHASYAKGYYDE